ncbi:MAG: hypothetical protein K2P57_12730 [Burkholderiales bacterium]|nr:hypothetical protein [Burkholderiales bacterium]
MKKAAGFFYGKTICEAAFFAHTRSERKACLRAMSKLAFDTLISVKNLKEDGFAGRLTECGSWNMMIVM